MQVNLYLHKLILNLNLHLFDKSGIGCLFNNWIYFGLWSKLSFPDLIHNINLPITAVTN